MCETYRLKRNINVSYTEYMESLIDKLINQQHQDCPNQQDNPNTVINSASSVTLPPHSIAPSPLASHVSNLVVVKQDINDPKKVWFLSS